MLAGVPCLAMIGMTEALIIGGVVIMIFGGKKLPELGRGLGQSILELKKGLQGVEEVKGEVDELKREIKP